MEIAVRRSVCVARQSAGVLVERSSTIVEHAMMHPSDLAISPNAAWANPPYLVPAANGG